MAGQLETFLNRVKEAYGDKVEEETRKRLEKDPKLDYFSTMQDVLGEMNKERCEGMANLTNLPLDSIASTPSSHTYLHYHCPELDMDIVLAEGNPLCCFLKEDHCTYSKQYDEQECHALHSPLCSERRKLSLAEIIIIGS